MATAIGMAGACEVLLQAELLGSSMRIPLTLVVIASLAWFVVNTARARAGGEPGVWAMMFAAAIWSAIAFGLVEQLPGLIDGHATNRDGDPSFVLAVLSVGGLVLVLAGLAQIARARGAEQALRVGSACALIVVVAGVASLGASWSDTPLPAIFRVGGLAAAYAACAYGLRAVGRSFGDGGDLRRRR